MTHRASCPTCGSVFRITDAQLAVAAGWAQCGVCGETLDTGPTRVAEAAQSELPARNAEAASQLSDCFPCAVAEFAPAQPAAAAASASEPAAPRRPRARTRWGALALLLAPLLLLQLVWFLRDTLVDRWPETRPWVVAACERLGCSVGLPRQLDALTIVGSELARASARERYTLEFTLGNRAPRVLAWPLVVVTLTDESARPYARRSFAASEYLAPGDATPGVPARQETPLVLNLTVRGAEPAGYQVTLAY